MFKCSPHCPAALSNAAAYTKLHATRSLNFIERFFITIKQYRRAATRRDKLGANYPAIKLALIRIWLRVEECTPKFWLADRF
jgi:hypothetical protein